MTKHQNTEDWERSFEKNYVYLLEREKEIEQEYYKYINRLPGEIIIIDKRKKKHEIREDIEYRRE